MSNKTIAKCLREKKSIFELLHICSNRINENAVLESDIEGDFNTEEQTEKYHELQLHLRDLKCAVAAASQTITVRVPDDTPTQEAGSDVPLFRAILIRDDMKSMKNVLQQLTEKNINPPRYRHREDAPPPRLTRRFDFESTLKKIEILQNSIDSLDAAIQYADNINKVDVDDLG